MCKKASVLTVWGVHRITWLILLLVSSELHLCSKPVGKTSGHSPLLVLGLWV